MPDSKELTRSLAAFALGSLAHKESSTAEGAVRSVLRIASLRKHPLWQIWAELQLTELVDEDVARDSVQHLLQDAFPDPQRRNQLFDVALREYLITRRRSLDPDSGFYLADIGDIERDFAVYEASLMREIDVDVLAQRDLRHRILNRVKNQAQRYLMSEEKFEGTTSAPASGSEEE
jgi:hypothetical protein